MTVVMSSNRRNSGRRARPIFQLTNIITTSLALALAAGCSSAPTDDGASASSALLTPPPIGCKTILRRTFLSQDDAFEAQLLANGCAPSANYVQLNDGTWFTVSCPATPETDALVAAYANLAPYLAREVTSPVGGACPITVDPGQVLVSFDPNCPACHI